MTVTEITDDAAQAIMDRWLRMDTVMGDWSIYPYDRIAFGCETKVGPLAGPPVSLRVRGSAAPGPQTFVGEARRMGINPRGGGPGECMMITAPKGDAWASAEEAMAALEAVLYDEHDPGTVRLLGWASPPDCW